MMSLFREVSQFGMFSHRYDRGVGEHNTFDEIQYSRKVKYIIVPMQESVLIKVVLSLRLT